MQEAVTGVIENHSKLCLKGINFVHAKKKERPGVLQAGSKLQLGCLKIPGSFGEACLGPLGRFGVLFWRPANSEGPPKFIC